MPISERKTHSKSCPEPTMKPVEPSPRHSRTPAWMRDCAIAEPLHATSVATSARMVEERNMVLPPLVDPRIEPADDIGRGRKREQRRSRTTSPTVGRRRLLQIAAEPLDAAAGFLEVFGLGRVGDAERRPGAERRPLHYRDTLGVEQLSDEFLVGLDLLARGRGPPDG